MSTRTVRSFSDLPARPKAARARRDAPFPSRLVYYIADAAFIGILIAPVLLMTTGSAQQAAEPDRPAVVVTAQSPAAR